MVRRGTAIAIAVLVVAGASAAMLARGRSAAHAERDSGTAGLSKVAVRDVNKQPFSGTPDPAAPAFQRSGEYATGALDGVNLVDARLRRGGYGSRALVSFILQNRNSFDVQNVALQCAFARADGRFTTVRTRPIADVVKMKSTKRYGPTLIGFVGAPYTQARCALVTAQRA